MIVSHSQAPDCLTVGGQRCKIKHMLLIELLFVQEKEWFLVAIENLCSHGQFLFAVCCLYPEAPHSQPLSLPFLLLVSVLINRQTPLNLYHSSSNISFCYT